MEDNSKLFVFEKKEVILIFVFVILIAVIAFTLGVSTGKKLSLKHDGYLKEDVQNIDLKSVEEEYVEKVIPSQESGSSNFEKSLNESESENSSEFSRPIDQDSVEAKLKAEMEKLAKSKPEQIENDQNIEQKKTIDIKEETLAKEVDDSAVNPAMDSSFKGKYTIQLFSHQSKSAAEDFADAFIAKGYDIIINEAVIPGKGKWYRVSIGIFDNVNEAKDYLEKEKSLFQGNSYIIQQFQ